MSDENTRDLFVIINRCFVVLNPNLAADPGANGLSARQSSGIRETGVVHILNLHIIVRLDALLACQVYNAPPSGPESIDFLVETHGLLPFKPASQLLLLIAEFRRPHKCCRRPPLNRKPEQTRAARDGFPDPGRPARRQCLSPHHFRRIGGAPGGGTHTRSGPALCVRWPKVQATDSIVHSQSDRLDSIISRQFRTALLIPKPKLRRIGLESGDSQTSVFGIFNFDRPPG